MKIKKIMVALLITSFMLTQSLQVNAYNNMNYSVQSKQLETLEGVEITKLNWNSSDWASGLEFPEIDKYSQDNKINNYAISIDTVIVNNQQYKKDINDENQNYVFEISAYGLRIKPGAFINGENVVVIKAPGYKDKEIIFNVVKELKVQRLKRINKKKIGRNEKCPCGSGKKYKKCCGKN